MISHPFPAITGKELQADTHVTLLDGDIDSCEAVVTAESDALVTALLAKAVPGTSTK